jgi:hypothetical protein
LSFIKENPMKKIIYITLLFILVLSVASCSKNGILVDAVPVSSITIVNAIPGPDLLIVNLTGAASVADFYNPDYPVNPQIGYPSFQQYSIKSGAVPVAIYKLSDITKPVFKSSVKLSDGGIYSLFLSGSPALGLDTLLVQDHLQQHSQADSTIGIRFVNLSKESGPLSVNVAGKATGSAVNQLKYKSITAFKNYAAPRSITGYVFEVRDGVSGDLISTNTVEVSAFQNITIAITGLQNPDSLTPIGIVRIKNY